MLDALHTNPTQLTGLLSFGAAAAACAFAARSQRGNARPVWRSLAIIHAALVIEVLLGLRHRLHDLGDAFLIGEGWYASRTGPQIGAIAVALVLALVGIVMAWRSRHAGTGVAGALGGTTLALALIGIEVISLHAVDALMYTRVGPVMLVGWLWAAAAGIVALCALWAMRR